MPKRKSKKNTKIKKNYQKVKQVVNQKVIINTVSKPKSKRKRRQSKRQPEGVSDIQPRIIPNVVYQSTSYIPYSNFSNPQSEPALLSIPKSNMSKSPNKSNIDTNGAAFSEPSSAASADWVEIDKSAEPLFPDKEDTKIDFVELVESEIPQQKEKPNIFVKSKRKEKEIHTPSPIFEDIFQQTNITDEPFTPMKLFNDITISSRPINNSLHLSDLALTNIYPSSSPIQPVNNPLLDDTGISSPSIISTSSIIKDNSPPLSPVINAGSPVNITMSSPIVNNTPMNISDTPLQIANKPFNYPINNIFSQPSQPIYFFPMDIQYDTPKRVFIEEPGSDEPIKSNSPMLIEDISQYNSDFSSPKSYSPMLIEDMQLPKRVDFVSPSKNEIFLITEKGEETPIDEAPLIPTKEEPIKDDIFKPRNYEQMQLKKQYQKLYGQYPMKLTNQEMKDKIEEYYKIEPLHISRPKLQPQKKIVVKRKKGDTSILTPPEILNKRERITSPSPRRIFIDETTKEIEASSKKSNNPLDISDRPKTPLRANIPLEVASSNTEELKVRAKSAGIPITRNFTSKSRKEKQLAIFEREQLNIVKENKKNKSKVNKANNV